MLPALNQNGSPDEKRLRKLFRGLDGRDQETLLRFAEFLAASPTQAIVPMTDFPEPEAIERPAQESVVKAIKRLRATYPMVNPDGLLHRTSDLMAEHVIKGRPASEVIDELEAMFGGHYQQAKAQFEQDPTGDSGN